MDGIARDSYIFGNTWIIMTILCCLALLAYVHKAYPARFGKLFRATFNERITRQVMREEMVFSHRASLILMLIAGIATSLNLILMYSYHQDISPRIDSFGLILLILTVLYLIRQGTRTLLNQLLGARSGLSEFNFVSSLIYKVLGLILLPLVIICSLIDKRYAVYLFTAGLIILVLAALFRWYRAWRIGRQAGGSAYHLMIYLCTLEILPLLVIVKGVVEGIPI